MTSLDAITRSRIVSKSRVGEISSKLQKILTDDIDANKTDNDNNIDTILSRESGSVDKQKNQSNQNTAHPEEHTTPEPNIQGKGTKQNQDLRNKIDRFVAQIKTETNTLGFDTNAPWRKNSSTSTSSGTAWFIRHPEQPPNEPTKYLITCAHCVEDAVVDGVTISVPAYTKYAARNNLSKNISVDVLAVYPDIDAALLCIRDVNKLFTLSPDASRKESVVEASGNNGNNNVNFYAFEFGDDTELVDNENLNIYGFPLGTESIKTISVHYNGRESYNIQMDGAINQGHSGAAILNKDNKVVGFVTSGVGFANNVSYGSPIGMLKPLLASTSLSSGVVHSKSVSKTPPTVASTRIIRQGDLGLSLYKSYLQMKDFLGTKCSGGLLVEYVFSQAHTKSIFHPNDLICAVCLSNEKNWYEITNEGKVYVKWRGSVELISFWELLQRWPVRAFVDVRYFDSVDRTFKTVENIQLKYEAQNGLKQYQFPWETPDYETIAGAVILPIFYNLRKFAKYVRPENLDQPLLVITTVLKPTVLSNEDVNITGILRKVNDVEVKTLAEFRQAFLKPVNNYIVFENDQNRRAVIPVATIIKEEPKYAQSKGYPISSLYSALRDAHNKNL